MHEGEHEIDPYWTGDLLLGEAILPRRGETAIRLRWHQAEERVRDHEELLPLAHKTGLRVYVHARPHVLKPSITLAVGLYPAPSETGAVGEVVGSEWEGMRHAEVGQAQAWYYPLDALLMLWECYLSDSFRQEDPTRDPAHALVWAGCEAELLRRFPGARLVATPAWEDLYERPAWQTFLAGQGFQPGPPGVFLKEPRGAR